MSSHGCRQSFLKGNISIYWLLLPFVLQLIVIRILANYLTSRYSEVISDPLLNPNSITLLLGLPVIVSMGLGYLILRWINRSHLGLSEVHEDSLQNNSNTEDTSEQKQIELDLRESQAKLKDAYIEQSILLGAMTDVVLVRNREGRCLKIAKTQNVNLKGTREEVLSKPIHEELPEEAANIILQTIQKALIAQQVVSCDYRLQIEGKEVWFASNISPLSEDTVIQISRNITERKLSEIALAQAKESAEAATKAKSDFLANMSHEIRTPMNGVLVMAQLLSTTELTEEQQDFVQTIIESGDVLLTIINDILDFSKIESGMLKIEQREYALADVFQSVCHLLNGQAKDKGISLQYKIHPEVPLHVIGDSTRLRQILVNIVGNAVKFTPQGAVSVVVSGNHLFAEDQKDQYELQVAVTDTGIGITGDRITNLFQAFMQADNSISRKYGGTGLGLAISKRLAELMGGTIWVESFGKVGGNPPLKWQTEQVTQGATFYFAIKVELSQ
ncbi:MULTISPECIES: PAS domain-containing hybrid sensor histidine kinase/response regulator [Pseudanabaena]|uniref:PAS domain-containing hybrid sensor histidine kinase/response regulator n=1 Tax=Pseudanabaena TaxID=1152 RepID=UPI00247935D3|nr:MULTISPECIES: PAS domain-containing hybrid sensor histidine kinase/response regulator [Pseudanabaena]MEA5489146.1 ATP-binding protein [Pseudanabaena sp. CCNP1317]WGS74550.1 ATP-binding protein [Pseudanabaena galeata CCNP1313]